MRKMIKAIITLMAAGIVSTAGAAVIVSYGFNNTLNPSDSAPNSTASVFGTGSGISANGYSAALYTEGTHSINWNKAGWNATEEGNAALRYLVFSVDVESGYKADLAELSFYYLRRDGTSITDGFGAPDSFSLYSSLDGFASPLVYGTLPGNQDDDNVFTKITTDLSGISTLQSIEGNIEFRIRMWASQGIGTTDQRRFFMDDFELAGEISVIPEPSTLGLLIISSITVFARRFVTRH